MNELVIAWNYAESVNKLKSMRYKWESLSIGMMRELEVAHDELSKVGRPETVTNVTIKSWSDYCNDVNISRMTAHRWLDKWKAIKEQQLQLEDDINIKDIKIEPKIIEIEKEIEPKINPLQSRLDEAERVFREKNNQIKVLNNQIKGQEIELSQLKNKERSIEEIEKVRDSIAELKKRQSVMLKDSDSINIILKVLVKSREFFTKECMIIPSLKVTEKSKELMHDDLQTLVDLVENWIEAIKQRLL